MGATRSNRARIPADKTVRTLLRLDTETHANLRAIADNRRLSMAAIIDEAIQQYINNQ